MMTQQYLRQLSLIVANNAGQGIDFGNFWCTFNVKRGDFQTPNSLDARIYNLSKDTANQISRLEFTTISLSAGYPGNVGLLFQGNIVQFRQGRVDQLDSYVDITAADSDEAYNFAPISATVPAGTKPGAIADLIRAAFANASSSQAITKGYQPNFTSDGLVRGRVLFGMARNEARVFANQNDCKWSLQDGAVTYIPWVSYIPGGEVPVISVATGLIGTPEQIQGGINIRTLLNPAIKIGQLIRLDSQINQFRFALDLPSQTKVNPFIAQQNQIAPNIGPNTGNPSDQQGLYYVMVANHTGDTRGQNWYTDMTCLSVDATVNVDQANALLQTGPNPISRYGGT
jgi:hypothetical protein